MPTNSPDTNRDQVAENREKARSGCSGCACSSGCLTVIAVFTLLIAVLMVSIPSIVRHFMLKGVPSSTRTRMDELMKTPANFPPQWKDVKPFSPALVAAAERARTTFDSINTSVSRQLNEAGNRKAMRKLGNNEALSAEELTSLTLLLASGQPAIDETSTVAHLSDYTGEALVSSTRFGFYSYNLQYQLPQLMRVAVHVPAIAGDWPDAASRLETAWRVAQTGDLASANADAYRRNACKTLSVSTAIIATSCTQAAPLRHLLDTLVEIRPNLVHVHAEDQVLVQAVGKLRAMSRDGFPVDLNPGKPAVSYALAALEAEMFEYPRYMAEHLPPTDPRQQQFAEAVRNMENSGPGRGLPLMFRTVLTFVPDVVLRFLCEESPANFEDERAQACVDLSILTLATRLHELEKSAPPTGLADLQSYLKQPLVDPFSGRPYLWDGASGRWYSVGPDHKDDHLKDLSSSGTNSGDIVLGLQQGRSDEY